MSTSPTTPAGVAPDLKARHRAMWASGEYARVADGLIPELGDVLVRETGVGAEDRVLDIAAGTGNAAIRAALTGADVVASDLTPELLAAGERRSSEAGVGLSWEQADAEALPYRDAAFDVALSCVGIMFAPFHERAAGELCRVVRPGGRIGLINWTPEGFIGQMFAVMKPYAPPPPEGATPPPRWGDETHVRELLGDRVTDLRAERRTVAIDAFGSGAEFRDFFKSYYGPTIVAYRANQDDPARVAALDEALAELGDQALVEGRMAWEYLLITAQRA
ncbi:class I SAM-dependent methyltransferase [Nocardioides insulae]|uniref:class I SAM-dependent methyltransferase n=1 Tax=Nocardioides insulae TaxID=394734 RepID=UPI0003FD594A|nr:class I SAM-dependent methyltransferase [Nocardioides insulae]